MGYAWTAKGVAQPHLAQQRYRAPTDLYTEYTAMDTPYWKRIAKIRASPNGMPPLGTDAINFAGQDMNIHFGHKTREYK